MSDQYSFIIRIKIFFSKKLIILFFNIKQRPSQVIDKYTNTKVASEKLRMLYVLRDESKAEAYSGEH